MTAAAQTALVQIPFLYCESSGIAKLPKQVLHLAFDPETHYLSAPKAKVQHEQPVMHNAIAAPCARAESNLVCPPCACTPMPLPPPSPPPTPPPQSSPPQSPRAPMPTPQPACSSDLSDEQADYARALEAELALLEAMPQVAPLTEKCLFERGDAPNKRGAIVSLLCCKRGSSKALGSR